MTERGRQFLRALTECERKILILVCAGWSNARIAERTDTTEQVVKNRLRLIMQKGGRRSRFELMAFSYHAGVVECPCQRRVLEAEKSATVGELERRREKPVDMLAPHEA
jgi:DNA-binding CsgD family transcriptional regulator